MIQFEASLESLDAAAQDDLSARVLDDVEVRAARLFPSITVAGFAPGSVVVTLSGGGSAATLVAVRFMPDSQITMSMACEIAGDIADGTPASYRLAGASARIVSTLAQCRGLPSAVPDQTTTAVPRAELNTNASAADDDGSWWVPIVVVVLFVVLLIGVLIMWRKRERANADVLAGLRTARSSSNPAYVASAGALAPFDNPTYSVGTPQGLGYLDVETSTYNQSINLDTGTGMASAPQRGDDDDLTYADADDDRTYADADALTAHTDGNATTYAVPFKRERANADVLAGLRTARQSSNPAYDASAGALAPFDRNDLAMYDTYDPVSSGGEHHYAIPMDGGAGVAIVNSQTGYIAAEGVSSIYASSSPEYQAAVELGAGDVQNSLA